MCGSILSPKTPKAAVVQKPDEAKEEREALEQEAKAKQRRIAAASQGRRSLTSSLIGGAGVTRKAIKQSTLF